METNFRKQQHEKTHLWQTRQCIEHSHDLDARDDQGDNVYWATSGNVSRCFNVFITSLLIARVPSKYPKKKRHLLLHMTSKKTPADFFRCVWRDVVLATIHARFSGRGNVEGLSGTRWTVCHQPWHCFRGGIELWSCPCRGLTLWTCRRYANAWLNRDPDRECPLRPWLPRFHRATSRLSTRPYPPRGFLRGQLHTAQPL